MPFRSEAQRRLMYAAAQNPEVAKKTGVPQSVANKYIAESHGKKLARKLRDHN